MSDGDNEILYYVALIALGIILAVATRIFVSSAVEAAIRFLIAGLLVGVGVAAVVAYLCKRK